MATTAQLRSLLSTYTRISPFQACEETKSLTTPPRLLVWLNVNGSWATMDQAQVSKLWSETSTSRSLCHLLFRDVLHLSESDYAELRKRLESSSFSGFYKGLDGSYAIVMQLKMNRYMQSIISGARDTTTGSGPYKYRHKFTLNSQHSSD
jgi:hypothetical protein